MYRILFVNNDDLQPWKCYGPGELAIHEGDGCVLEVAKVLEYGTVAGLVQEEGEPPPAVKDLPVVLRRATLQDQSKAKENQLFAKSALRVCHDLMRRHSLAIRLMRVRYSFDRSRLLVAFMAEETVDFRAFVQDLAAETRARVEMRQIGVRDAAGMIGGLAPCGRELCCKRWLKTFENVNIRMAKQQGLSLNPSTINGMCGRLKCCLRFEQNCYRELEEALPPVGSQVTCPMGDGRILDRNILKGRVRVALQDQRIMEFPGQDVKMLGK
ncbi:MAG: stage 0 sporulation protein [Lentisphaerae bacterium]|nr:stage 0 sporulation protein [Lentisphaerota bacterium]